MDISEHMEIFPEHMEIFPFDHSRSASSRTLDARHLGNLWYVFTMEGV